MYDLATATIEDDEEVFISVVVFETELPWEVDGSISSLWANNLIKKYWKKLLENQVLFITVLFIRNNKNTSKFRKLKIT